MPLAGMALFPAVWLGGILFVISILLAGRFTPGYSYLHQSISELGGRSAPCSRLLRWVGFVPFGLSFALFSLQTHGLFLNRFPSVLFLLMGFAIFIAGIFPTDPYNRRDTFSGKAHASAVILLLFLLSLAPFALAFFALYRNPPPDWFFIFSISMGILGMGLLVMITKSGRQVPTTGLYQIAHGEFVHGLRSLHGLHQRILLTLHSVWWLIFTIVLSRQS
ncbi:MAG: DUF998 domain-containing protein [Chloroflexota bacterium]